MKFGKLITIGLISSALFAFTQVKVKIADSDKINGKWLNQEGTSHIMIYKVPSTSRFYGKITWLKEPNENGKPRVDKNNPDKNKRNNPLLGLEILKNFVYNAGDKEWSKGTIYDPKNGKTYSCYISFDKDKLNVRGYVGVSLFGRTAVWTRTH